MVDLGARKGWRAREASCVFFLNQKRILYIRGQFTCLRYIDLGIDRPEPHSSRIIASQSSNSLLAMALAYAYFCTVPSAWMT